MENQQNNPVTLKKAGAFSNPKTDEDYNKQHPKDPAEKKRYPDTDVPEVGDESNDPTEHGTEDQTENDNEDINDKSM